MCAVHGTVCSVEQYTYTELRDMHFTYGTASGNAHGAEHLYRETYPKRHHHPLDSIFAAIHQHLCETSVLRVMHCRSTKTVEQLQSKRMYLYRSTTIYEHVSHCTCNADIRVNSVTNFA
ncbi:hypothetical protein PR048_007613 [Dryococelus australis]|uniref:DUF4817 domain-containing protein n=1 Tax=Dryococelus australis TaxID=614101 RepID=A0ABQ9HVL7_9NEOP|nr:hypothetical protein PR048_007613 [Dryococelus australis]